MNAPPRASSAPAPNANAEQPAAGVDIEKLNLTRETFKALDKVIRTTTLFGPRHSNVEKAREEFKEKLGQCLARAGELVLELDGAKVLCDGVVVVDNSGQKDDVAFRLFQDGVIRLTLTDGLAGDEIDAFLGILTTPVGLGAFAHDDTVTLFWEADLPHVAVLIAPEYAETMGDPTNPPAGTEGFREARLQIVTRQVLTGPRQPGSDEDAGRAAHLRTLLAEGGGLSLTEDERAAISAELAASDPQLVEKYLEILFRLFVQRPDAPGMDRLRLLFAKLVLGIAENRALDRVGRILNWLRIVATREDGDPDEARSATALLEVLATRPLINALLDAPFPAGGGPPAPEALALAIKVVALLPESAVTHLLDHLEHVVEPKLHADVVRLLAVRGRNQVPLFQAQLGTASDRHTGDLLQILTTIDTPEANDALLEVAFHKRAEVRLKVLEIIGRNPGKRHKKVVLDLLGDASSRIRLEALRAAGRHATDPMIVGGLSDFVRGKAFAEFDKDEKRRFCLALGQVAGEATLPLMRELAFQGNLWRRPRTDEIKAAAVYTLGALVDRPSRDAIQAGAGSRLGAPLFKAACAEALRLLDHPEAPRPSIFVASAGDSLPPAPAQQTPSIAPPPGPRRGEEPPP